MFMKYRVLGPWHCKSYIDVLDQKTGARVSCLLLGFRLA